MATARASIATKTTTDLPALLRETGATGHGHAPLVHLPHLLEWRIFAGWSQNTLARRSGVDAKTISRLEHGTHSCRLDTLGLLARALDIAPAVLVSRAPDVTTWHDVQPHTSA